MIRFIYVIIMNLFRAPFMLTKMRRWASNPEKHTEEECYALAKYCIRLMKLTGAISTKAYGTEHLPKEGGYMMYPNHQGKYDVFGIIHKLSKGNMCRYEAESDGIGVFFYLGRRIAEKACKFHTVVSHFFNELQRAEKISLSFVS